LETHAVRNESRDELERGVEEMRSRGWLLWRVVGVPGDALIAYFGRRASPYPPERAEETDRGRGRRDDT
jgi:hypothetical protein